MTTESQKAAIHLQSQVTIHNLVHALKRARDYVKTSTHRKAPRARLILQICDQAIADAEEMPTC